MRLKEVRILVIREEASTESFPQSSDSCEECVRIERPSHKWNMKGMMVIRTCMLALVRLTCNTLNL